MRNNGKGSHTKEKSDIAWIKESDNGLRLEYIKEMKSSREETAVQKEEKEEEEEEEEGDARGS